MAHGRGTPTLTARSDCVQTSCSLQHVPLDTARETKLDAGLKRRLAFAVQKLAELRTLADAPAGGKAAATDSRPSKQNIDAKMFSRPAPYEQRRKAQFAASPQVCTPAPVVRTRSQSMQ